MCVLHFLPVRFEENDDICMLLIASGGYSGTPDAHLVFINYIYGLGIKTLYTLYQGVEWYTLLFVVLHTLSISILLLSVIKATENKVLKILFVVLFWSIELQILLHLQFTTTAALVWLAGVVLLLEQQTSRRVAGVILCVIGSWLRLEISLVVLFISFPLFLKELLVHRKLLLSGSLAYLGVAVLLIGAFEMIDQASYREEGGWKAYAEYNKVRGRINDNPNASALADRLPQEIEPVDYALLLRFFQDGTVLNSKKLNLLYNKLSFEYSNSKFNWTLSSLTLYKKYFLLLIAIVALAIVNTRVKADRMVLLASMLLFAVVAFAMALIVSLKYRIFLSAVLPFLYSISRSVNRNRVGLSVKLLSVFSLLLCLFH